MDNSEITDGLYKISKWIGKEAKEHEGTYLADVLDRVQIEIDELHDEIAESEA